MGEWKKNWSARRMSLDILDRKYNCGSRRGCVGRVHETLCSHVICLQLHIWLKIKKLQLRLGVVEINLQTHTGRVSWKVTNSRGVLPHKRQPFNFTILAYLSACRCILKLLVLALMVNCKFCWTMKNNRRSSTATTLSLFLSNRMLWIRHQRWVKGCSYYLSSPKTCFSEQKPREARSCNKPQAIASFLSSLEGVFEMGEKRSHDFSDYWATNHFPLYSHCFFFFHFQYWNSQSF